MSSRSLVDPTTSMPAVAGTRRSHATLPGYHFARPPATDALADCLRRAPQA